MSCCALPHRRLGLNLTRRSVEAFLFREKKSQISMLVDEDSKIEDVPRSLSNKVKASNFPVNSIIIGNWKLETLNSGDLMAKIYYAKRRLVWEVLNGPLKWKIEIKWSDITAIQATLDDQGRGILEIELNQPPSFFGETEPQPRKHTNWVPSYDFTGGHALRWRIHSLVFPPKALDKNYTQLLQCDERLFALSQRPFPSQESPYFDPIVLQASHEINGQETRFSPEPQDLTYPTIAGDFPVELPQNSTVSPVINHQYPPQGQVLWNQETDFSWENGNMQGSPYISSVIQSDPIIPYSNYQSSTGLLDNLQNHLLGGSEIVYTDERTLYANAESLNGANYLAATHQIAYDGIGVQSADDACSPEIEKWNAINRMTSQESGQWMAMPQVAVNSNSLLVDERSLFIQNLDQTYLSDGQVQ